MSSTLPDGRDARCPQICNGGCDRLKRAEADLQTFAEWEDQKIKHAVERMNRPPLHCGCESHQAWDDRLGVLRCASCGRVLS